MDDPVRRHYERYVYPCYSYLASVCRCDTYALNLQSLWAHFNGEWLPAGRERILLAGAGSFSPYPTSVANPKGAITALDLSRPNLRRAQIHSLLHNRRNIRYEAGDLLDPAAAPGEFHFIDCYGVLHHLADPPAGLCALYRRLSPGGILRIMVYSRSARREAESIRRAMRLLRIDDIPTLKKLIRRARHGSRLADYLAGSFEATFDSGLADAFLHPLARTFRIDELLPMVEAAGFTPLRFAHRGALPDVTAEVERVKRLEATGEFNANFILYLGKETKGGRMLADGGMIRLNPAIDYVVGRRMFGSVKVAEKLGVSNPLVDGAARRLLRRFRQPVPVETLTAEERARLAPFIEAMFLVVCNS